MAFILPLTVLGSSVSGFAVGYYYNFRGIEVKQQVPSIDIDNITVNDLKILKEKNPHKKIHHELVTFDKQKLKPKPKTHTPKLTEDQEMMEILRKKIINRRDSIGDIDLSELN